MDAFLTLNDIVIGKKSTTFGLHFQAGCQPLKCK